MTKSEAKMILDQENATAVRLMVERLPDDQVIEIYERDIIGDSLAPRTAEEAVYEGLKVAAVL